MSLSYRIKRARVYHYTALQAALIASAVSAAIIIITVSVSALLTVEATIRASASVIGAM